MTKAKVTVAFTRETSPDKFSKGIMKYLKTNYSHVFFIHNGIVHHAVEEGVTEIPLSKYLEDHIIVAQKEVTLEVSDERFLGYMDGAKDKEYSFSQFFGIMSPVLRFLGRNGNEKMICSELVAVVLIKYASLKFSKENDFITPKDVFKTLQLA